MSPGRAPAARMLRAITCDQVSMSFARVAHHRGLAGGAAGRMDAHALLARHREHAERDSRRAGRALLVNGNLRQVGERAAVVRMHAGRIELGAVDGRVGVRVRQRGAQALELQRAQFVDAGLFDRLEGKALHHGSCGMTWPWICALLPRNIATTSPRWLVTFMSYTPCRPCSSLLDALAGEHVAQVPGLEELDAGSRPPPSPCCGCCRRRRRSNRPA